ncbi:MAG TPA: ATP-binding cassette domain-containing protein [Frankiaceae bacterium]|jgi:ABC-type branched-subunit amino acid transport system ATPase component|nr:ATP-binding cassette domain-containing protein [Frankiaceae bacterium]
MSLATDRRSALRVEDIEFSYGRLQVLFGVSLEVGEGEAVALLGTNGAGKSTLLRVITGLERPTRGTVSFFDTDITNLPAEDRPGEGLLLVVGGRSVFADMTVTENLEMAALPARHAAAERKQRLDHVYAAFPGLAERRRQRAGTLSGGEQQQLALAKALLLDPKVLCIDELSLGLAPLVVGELLQLVKRINATGVSVIIVEQSLNIASEICERSIFLEKGEVRFEGPTRDLLARDDVARAVFLGARD